MGDYWVIATHPHGSDQRTLSRQSTTVVITLQSAFFFSPLSSLCILCEKCWGQNHFAKPNWHVLTFLLHSIFVLMGHTHTLSTCGASCPYRTQNVHNTNTRCVSVHYPSFLNEKKMDGGGAKGKPREKEVNSTLVLPAINICCWFNVVLL